MTEPTRQAEKLEARQLWVRSITTGNSAGDEIEVCDLDGDHPRLIRTTNLLPAEPQGKVRPPQQLMEAAKNLLEACYQADAKEELSEMIDGSLLDMVRDGLIAASMEQQAALAASGGAQSDAEENLADYLLRNQPPTWDYAKVLELARKVATSGASARMRVTGDGLRKLAYTTCGLGPEWMMHAPDGIGTRWDKLADALNTALARQSQPLAQVHVHNSELGKILGTIHSRFNDREPHSGAWDEQRIVVAEVIQGFMHAAQADAVESKDAFTALKKAHDEPPSKVKERKGDYYKG